MQGATNCLQRHITHYRIMRVDLFMRYYIESILCKCKIAEQQRLMRDIHSSLLIKTSAFLYIYQKLQVSLYAGLYFITLLVDTQR